MIKKCFLLIALSLIVGRAYCQNDDQHAIAHILELQAQQWNKGSIDGYMQGYWHSDSLLFIGKNGPEYGYENTLQRYKKAYPDAAHMGKLSLTVKSMKQLSPEYYFIVGTWALQRSAGNIRGNFTLLFRKINGVWYIVADHSS